MQYTVYLKHLSSDGVSMKHSRTVEAATEQDAIEAVLDACPAPDFFVVDHVEPAAPAQE